MTMLPALGATSFISPGALRCAARSASPSRKMAQPSLVRPTIDTEPGTSCAGVVAVAPSGDASRGVPSLPPSFATGVAVDASVEASGGAVSLPPSFVTGVTVEASGEEGGGGDVVAGG